MNNSPRRGIFDQLRKSPVQRADSQWLGGVATGVADYFKIDVVLVRGIFVVLSVLGGLGMVLYGLAWAVLPNAQGQIHLEDALNRTWNSGMTGAVILFAAGIFPAPWFFDSLAPILWPIAIVAAIAFIIFSRKNTRFARPEKATPEKPTPEKATPGDPSDTRSDAPAETGTSGSTALEPTWRETDSHKSRAAFMTDAESQEYTMSSTDPSGHPQDYTYTAKPAKLPKKPVNRPVPGWVATIVLGISALSIAAVLLGDYLNLLDLQGYSWAVALACGLLVVGLAILFAALSGRTSGGLLGLGIPLLVLTLVFSTFSFEPNREVVRSVDGNESTYNAVFTNSTIDLTHLGTISEPTTVEIDAVFSNLKVLLPDNVPVQVKSDGAFLSGTTRELPQNQSALPATTPTLTIEVDGAFTSFTTAVGETSTPTF